MDSKKNKVLYGMAIGMCLGVMYGVTIAELFHIDFSTCAGAGLCIGVIVGALYGKRKS